MSEVVTSTISFIPLTGSGEVFEEGSGLPGGRIITNEDFAPNVHVPLMTQIGDFVKNNPLVIGGVFLGAILLGGRGRR